MTGQDHPRPGAAEPALVRRLGTGDAVLVGLGAMLGAGVFSVFGPAAAAAGAGLLIALVLAAAVAYCNAVASAQLAAQYPTSGGTYVYGRERLGPWVGFAAGWCFVIGKTASCAAMALTFAAYVLPGEGWVARGLAALGVMTLTGVNLRGVTRTAGVNRVLVAATVAALGCAVVGIAVSGVGPLPALSGVVQAVEPRGVLQAAGLLFFAFAGYARIATLGEEVRDPERTIPRAIPLALGIVVTLYAVVAVTLLAALGPGGLAGSTTPLADAARLSGAGWLLPVVRGGAVLASLGALLGLMAGVGRTSLAMARNGDLPRPLAAVSARTHVPSSAQVALAFVVTALVLLVDLPDVIAFSSFGVLLYYGIANASAFTQDQAHRRWPRALNVVGLAGCLALAASLPTAPLLTGLGVLIVGLVGRAVVRFARSDPS